MAQRVSGFSKRPSGGGRAAERARSATEPEGEPIPLDLASVVAPYRRHRGLSIRVERLAHGARLSQGRNNGDRSWSLAPDELDGLEYLPANESYEAHTLAVRIISLEGGDGETLAVIDLPIAGRAPTGMETPGTASAPGALNAEMQRLRDELVKVKSALATRETELATAKRSADALERSRQALKSEFSAAEATWARELREQLAAAAAEASANLEKSRTEWDSERKQRAKADAGAQKSLEEARKRWQQDSQTALAKAQAEWKLAETARLASEQAKWRDESSKALAELRARAEQAESALIGTRTAASAGANDVEFDRLREDLSRTEAKLATRDAELAEMRAAVEFARMRSQDSATDVKKAEQAWRAAETIRLAGVEARWKEQSTKAVAQVTARLEEAEAALAEARADVVQAKSQNSAMDLKKAEQAWKTAEAVRFAAAEAGWKEQGAEAVAEMTAKFEQADAALADARAQADARLHQINALQISLGAREKELAMARAAVEEARSRATDNAEQTRVHWQKEMAAAVSKTQENFKTGESARLAAAEAQWKAQFATSLAESATKLQHAEAELAGANAELESIRNSSGEERRRLQDELAAAQTELATRESELADANIVVEQARATADQSLQNVAAEIEKARKQWKKEADAALRKAEQAWRAEEAPRIAAAEVKWQEQVAANLASAEDRRERAEGALADARACSEALRHELAAAQASLAHREIELAQARAVLEQERERMRQIPLETVERRPAWQEDREERQAQFRRRLIRDFAVVASVAGLVFMVIPHIQPVVAEAWPQDLSLKSDLKPLLQMAGLYTPPAAAPAAAPQQNPRATVEVRVANLRAQPSTSAAVVTKLPRNVEVIPVERRGKWVFVRIGEGPAQKQGWVASSVLKGDFESAPNTE